MRHLKTRFIIMVILVLTLTACNKQPEPEIIDITEVSREVNYDKDTIYNEAISYVNGTAQPESFKFNESDIINNSSVNNYYYFNSSVYIQIDKYMYRFQLDSENKIVSYIKYNLEA